MKRVEALEVLKVTRQKQQHLRFLLMVLALCIDSVHRKSQAHFTAAGWEDADIVIDEATQVLWHTLSSSTM